MGLKMSCIQQLMSMTPPCGETADLSLCIPDTPFKSIIQYLERKYYIFNQREKMLSRQVYKHIYGVHCKTQAAVINLRCLVATG